MVESPLTATAIAHPNIAFIKYWGNRDELNNLPANSSVSLTLGGLLTRTSVTFSQELDEDHLILDGTQAKPSVQRRASEHLDRIRTLAGVDSRASVLSQNSFPMGAGIASSASAFAALTLAATSAAHMHMERRDLSRLARAASGSAARSIFGGYVLWNRGEDDSSSYAQQVASPEHWALVDWILVVDAGHKSVSSSHGHRLAETSPYQAARVGTADDRIERCLRAIQRRDFDQLASVSELDSDMMHAVMMTSEPSLHYWRPDTLRIMETVRRLRESGLPVFYTLDAGPNPHCICLAESADRVGEELRRIPGVTDMFRAEPGRGARLVSGPG